MSELDQLEKEMRLIDKSVARIEVLADKYIENREMYYEEVQKLMDRRDELFKQKIALTS